MKYMIETSMMVCLIQRKPPKLVDRFMNSNTQDICISAITLARLMNAAMYSVGTNEDLKALMQLMGKILVLPFNAHAALEYGLIKDDLDRNHIQMGLMDLLIAAHARSEKLVLVTSRVGAFSPVRGLECDNWLEDA